MCLVSGLDTPGQTSQVNNLKGKKYRVERREAKINGPKIIQYGLNIDFEHCRYALFLPYTVIMDTYTIGFIFACNFALVIALSKYRFHFKFYICIHFRAGLARSLPEIIIFVIVIVGGQITIPIVIKLCLVSDSGRSGRGIYRNQPDVDTDRD